MSEFSWVLRDEAGNDLRRSESFSSKEEAESWMGSEWQALRSEGADSVTLMHDGTVVYKMSLQDA